MNVERVGISSPLPQCTHMEVTVIQTLFFHERNSLHELKYTLAGNETPKEDYIEIFI